jgi:Transcription factor zinc-finger
MTPIGEARAVTTRCPGCGNAMRAVTFDTTPHGRTDIDLCDDCHALWFDAFESVRLTPAATLGLFREVHGAAAPARRAIPMSLACPRCRGTLAPTQDLQRSTRFTYWRCPKGHGRFTPFVQFLREKDFVRPLSAAEIEKLKVHIRSVRCSGCGAAVDLARDMACRYCRAPIEALDPNAVTGTIDALERAEKRRTTLDVDRLADAILAHPPRPAWQQGAALDTTRGVDVDLIGAGVALVLASLVPD